MNQFLAELQKSNFVDQPELELRWITEHFGANKIDKIQSAIQRRKDGEPLAYILGEKEFYGINFFVNENVLIPRPETELLVDLALNYLDQNNKATDILDLGCGSGCIGLSLLKKNLKVNLVAADISSLALEVAKKNAIALGLIGRSQFVECEATRFGQQINKNFDIIVANPPYVDATTKNKDVVALSYEPELALYAEDLGRAFIPAWLNAVAKHKKKSYLIAFEIGFDQGEYAKQVFTDSNFFDRIELHKDLAGHDRVILGIKN